MTHPKADGLDALKREIDKHLSKNCKRYDDNPFVHFSIVAQTIDHLAQRGMIVPDGWVAVPREITEDMFIAFAEQWFSKPRCIDDCEMEDCYKEMLAAAPKMEGMA